MRVYMPRLRRAYAMPAYAVVSIVVMMTAAVTARALLRLRHYARLPRLRY